MSTEAIKENKMGVMPVNKLLVNMALPMIASMIVQALYNVVDSIYVAQISESAVTALSLAFPIQNVQLGFAIGIGVGINALLSKSLGRKDFESANMAAGNGISLVLIASVAVMLFGVFGVEPYYRMQSSVAETVEGGIAYSRIVCLCTLGMYLQITTERLLQATGRTFHSMIVQATGAIINIIMDPVMIFGWFGFPAMGVAGAAAATVLGQWIGALVGLFLNWKYNQDIQLKWRYLKLKRNIVVPVLMVGIPSIVMNCIGSIMNFGMNQIFQSFNETATSVFGIYYKLQSFFFMPLFGMNGATISIIAYNYGARKPDRMLKTLKLALCAGMTVMLLGLAAFQLVPELLLGMFNPSPAFLEMGCSALRIISLHFPIAAVGIILGASFQALGNGIYSTTVSLCRQLIVLLPVAYLLSLTGNVNMVWWAFPIAEVFSCMVTLFFFRRIYVQKVKPLREQ